MTFQFTYAGKKYIPTLKDEKLALWGVASYGQMEHKGTLLLRIYALVKAPRNADTNKAYRNYRIVAHSMRVSNTTPEADQLRYMGAMMRAVEIAANREACVHYDYVTRKPKKEK